MNIANATETEITATDDPAEHAEQATPEDVAGIEGDARDEEPAPTAVRHDQPPEFWSAERKALWDRIADPEVRVAIHAQEKERVAATSRKIEEAALTRKALEERMQQFGRERGALAQWLSETAPRMAQAFQGRWSQYDWPKLAAENPAEFARLSAQRDAEFATIQQAAQRHQQELQAARERAAQASAQRRQAESDKLARQYPEHFGAERARRTYEELASYLVAQGVPYERIQNTFESSIVGVALKAMLYDKAQAALRARNASAPGGPPTTATQTPRRIAPGPGHRPGHPAGEAARQAEQRLRTGQALSDEDVATLFG
ncbi:hypothetical protein [Enhydrobacter sp.]|uniref:hypothetical protein n=1 Tax=Enhydrobacter sp. TaxID=1894999 RepID=UPI002637F95A|nr:hypothetical protein [Enhydrobacter sp.]WIM14497.1 MAG: hypothetical protein OJF58_005467 [Enhydrobacter sp.]